ncbi:MAG TPA: translocation/assembly module TamB domain-containing protein [Candidatus Binatia bacterium]|jgi:translocation and assembly module TamB|nr:translocation/assembly module TamB domain-containing protein [Candidatus Binatia bacterium]
MRRLARWVLRTVIVLVVITALLVGGTLLFVRTTPGEAALRAELVRLLTDITGARVTLGALRGSFVRTVDVTDIVLRFDGGTELRVGRLRATLSPLSLLHGLVLIDDVALERVRVRAVHTAEGWGLPHLPDDDDTRSGRPLPRIVLRAVHLVDGRVAIALRDADPPRQVAATALALDAGVTLGADGIEVRVDALSTVPRGIDLSPLTAQGTLRLPPDGGLVLENVVAATVRSHVTLAGALVPHVRLDVTLTDMSVAAREARALLPGIDVASDVQATGRASGPWNACVVSANVGVGAGRVGVDGAVDLAASPPRWSTDVSLAAVDPAAALATLPAGQVNSHIRAAGTGANATAHIRVGPSTIAGQSLDRAFLDVDLHGSVLRAAGRVAHAAGVASIRARAELGTPLRYRARTHANITNLAALVPSTPGTAALRATVSGVEPDAAERTVRLQATIDHGEVRGVALAGGTVDARLEGARLHVDRAQVRGPGAEVTAWGAADLDTKQADATLDVKAALDVVGRQASLPLGGTATARATATGRLDGLAVEARVVVERGRWDTTDVRRAEVVTRAAGLGGSAPSARATATASAIHVPGRDPWDAAAELDWRRAGGTDDGTLRASGRATNGAGMRMALTAKRTDPTTVVQLTELLLDPADQPAWQLARPARITVADGIAVDELALTSGGQRITLSGVAGTTGKADATLRATGIGIASLCGLLAKGPRCAGTLTADARLTGTAAAPELSATAAIDQLRIDDAVYGPLTARAQYAARALAVQARLSYAQAGNLDVDGTLPVDLAWAGERRDLSSAPVSLALRTQGLDLAFLRAIAPTVVRRSEGRLTADLRLRGAWNDLRAEGGADLTMQRLELAATGVPYEEVRLRLRAAESSIVVEELAARGGDGTLTGSGRIALSGLRPGEADVRVRLSRFLAVRLPAYEAATDGDLTIGGPLTAPEIRGRVDLTRAVVRPSVLPSSNPSRQPDPTIEVVGLPPAPPTETNSGPGLAEALVLAIEVRIRDNAWVRRDDANIELAADLRLDKASGGPVLISGNVRLVRGWYAFQGRRFDLDEGNITFDGTSPPDPYFNITASHRTGQYRVLVEIGGSAQKPTLALSSEPALDQADILAVLLFGRPSGDLGKGESLDLQKQAVSLAAGYVMPELRSSVMNALSLDSLEVGGEGVRAGRYVTQDVFVSLSQEFGPQKGQAMAVEYGFTPSISLKLSTSTRGDSAVDLLWHHRY